MTAKTKRTILIAILLVASAGAVIGYKMWNKPFKNALSGDAIVVTPDQLLNDFVSNEAEARKKYVPESVGDKVLEITGEVRETGMNSESESFYILKTSNEMSGIKCIMEDDKNTAVAKAGDKITIRGFCNGYSGDEMIPGVGDVIVNRCKLVKK